MRLRTSALFLVLQCSLLAVAASAHAQAGKPCGKPHPDSSLTKEQQDAKDGGDLTACTAATATDSHPLREEPKPSRPTGGVALDDAITGDVLANTSPTDSDYYRTIEQRGCPNLLAAAKKRASMYTSDAGRLGYLNAVVGGMLAKGRCH
jgi:hypothetical protein